MGPHVYVYYYYCSHAQNEKKIEMNMRTRLPVYSKFKGFSVRAGAVIKSLLGDWNKKANVEVAKIQANCVKYGLRVKRSGDIMGLGLFCDKPIIQKRTKLAVYSGDFANCNVGSKKLIAYSNRWRYSIN